MASLGHRGPLTLLTLEGSAVSASPLTIGSPVGPLTTSLDPGSGLNIVAVGAGFGISAESGGAYFAPSGASPGEQAILSLNPVTGGPVLTTLSGLLDLVRRPRESVTNRQRPRPYAGRTRPARQAAWR